LTNLFENIPVPSEDEQFIELLSRPGARIERIVSNGHVTPVSTPFDQGVSGVAATRWNPGPRSARCRP